MIPFFNRLQKRVFFTPPGLIQSLCTTNEIDNFSFGRLGYVMEEILLVESQDSGYVLYWGQILRKSLLRVKWSWKRKIENSIFEDAIRSINKSCSTDVLFLSYSYSIHVYFMYKPGSSYLCSSPDQILFNWCYYQTIFKSCASCVQVIHMYSSHVQVTLKVCSMHAQVMLRSCSSHVQVKNAVKFE